VFRASARLYRLAKAPQYGIILHELAHKLQPSGFLPDGWNPAQSERNTDLLMKHCGWLIGQ